MKLVNSSYEGTDKQITVIPSGDWHIGHINTNYQIISSFIDKLNYATRGLLMGDLLECATKESIGKGLYDTTMSPNKQKDYLIELLRPKAQFIDGCVIGNHEERITNISSIDLLHDICKELKIPYLKYSGIVKYAWNEVCYTIYMWHGTSSGSGIGSAFNGVEAMANRVYADVYCMGHIHKLGCTSREFTMPDTRNNMTRSITQKFVLTGSALDYEDGYGEMKGLHKRELGFPSLILKGSKNTRNVIPIYKTT